MSNTQHSTCVETDVDFIVDIPSTTFTGIHLMELSRLQSVYNLLSNKKKPAISVGLSNGGEPWMSKSTIRRRVLLRLFDNMV